MIPGGAIKCTKLLAQTALPKLTLPCLSTDEALEGYLGIQG